jgi:hypothetical protein
VIRRVASRATRGRYRRFRGMLVLLRRFAIYHQAILREVSATGRRRLDRVNHLIIHDPRALVTGVPPVLPPAFRSPKSRRCFPRPLTFLITLDWFPRSARQSDINRSSFLPFFFSLVTTVGRTPWRSYSSPKCPQSSAPQPCLVCL